MNSPTRAVVGQRLWLLLLPALVLGPVLFRSGYTLTYDMVWVPQLSMRPSFLGVGTRWPRAVPSDAVVAVLDNVIPGAVLQRLTLYAALALAAFGVARLLPRQSTIDVAAGTVAATFYVWNPFVAERLLIGHWPVLLGYAALPWVLVHARSLRSALVEGRSSPVVEAPEERGRWRDHHLAWAALALFVWLGSLSASAGLVTAGVVLVAIWRRRRWGSNLLALLIVGCANAPWVVAGLLHRGLASDPAGVLAFAAHGEGGLPAPLATLSLGGIWNETVVPDSRSGVFIWISLLVLQLPMLLVARRWWRETDGWERRTLVSGAVLGWLIALLGWAAPGLLGSWVEAFAPMAMIRDGARYLGPMALLEACLLAVAARWLLTRSREWRAFAAVALACVPLILLPDLAWGAFGKLQPTHYPRSYSVARAALNAHLDDPGQAVLVLPFASYRAPAWNRHQPVLDPLPRFIAQDSVINDGLQISGRAITGEDPLARDVRRLLDEIEPEGRADALGRLGIAAAVSDLDTGLTAQAVEGQNVVQTPQVKVELLGGSSVATDSSSKMSLLLAWLGHVLLVLAGVVGSAVPGWRRSVRRRSVSNARLVT